MNDDIERILKRAAAMCGAKRTDYSDQTPDHWIINEPGTNHWAEWNPLVNDLDAYRLAMACGLTIWPSGVSGRYGFSIDVEPHADPAVRYAQLRVAIVAVAAKIAIADCKG